MAVKRIVTDEKTKNLIKDIKSIRDRKKKGNLSQKDYNDLIELIAKKLGIL